jgi:hypothetical protein
MKWKTVEAFAQIPILLLSKSCKGSELCAEVSKLALASRLHEQTLTRFRLWVGWFGRNERLDWNSETGVHRARTGALFFWTGSF